MPGKAPSISPTSGEVLVSSFKNGSAKSSWPMPAKLDAASCSKLLIIAIAVDVSLVAKSVLAMVRFPFFV